MILFDFMNKTEDEQESTDSGTLKRKLLAAQRCLMDNGIEADETPFVMQALGAILFDEELEDLLEWDSKKIPYESSIWE